MKTLIPNVLETVLIMIILFLVIGAASDAEERQLDNRRGRNGDRQTVGEAFLRNPILDAQILAIMEEYHIPGAAVSTFCTGRVYHLGTYGYAQLEDSIPVTEGTQFAIGSISKAITGTVMMQVWEDAQFSLDDDVNDFADFPVVHPTCPDSAVTFRKAMTHTASFHDVPITVPVGTPLCYGLSEYVDPEGEYHHDFIWNPACPGVMYEYNPLGPTLLACLISEIGGPSFPEYCQTHLFDPLMMDGTVWFGDLLNPDEVAYSYVYNDDEYHVMSTGGDDDFMYPARCLRTDIDDLTRLAQALMQGGILGDVRILEDATVDSMFTEQFPRVAEDQGLIWDRRYIEPDWYWGHLGGIDQYAAAVLIQEDRDYGVIVMINGGGYTGGFEIVYAALEYARDNLEDCAVSAPDTPSGFNLYPNYPNPFNPQTTIKFELPVATTVSLRIYDLSGRLVKVLANKTSYAAGSHSIVWSGGDDRGREVPSGTYIVRLETESGVEARKVTLVR